MHRQMVEGGIRWWWMKVWKLDVIPKIQHFMWRVLHGILPSCINLVGRFVDVSPFCKRCGDELETTEHALRDCGWVRQFWENEALFRPTTMDGSMEEWVGEVMQQSTREQVAMFATSLWYLWFWRNQLQFSGRYTTHAQLALSVEVQRSDFARATQRRPPREERSRADNDGWRPPDGGGYKLNCDATVRDGGEVAIARVVRDCRGRVVWCFAKRGSAAWDVPTAEAMAVKRGLRLAKEQGWDGLIVETDAQMVVKAVRAPDVSLSYFGNLISDIVCFSGSFNSVSFVWTRRTGNVLAHRLALFGLSCSRPFFSFVIPATLEEFVMADLRPIR